MERLLLDSSPSILMVVPFVNISFERRFLSIDSSLFYKEDFFFLNQRKKDFVFTFFNGRFRFGFSSFIFE